MNRSAQWIVEGYYSNEWESLTEWDARNAENRIRQLNAYHYPMKRRPLFHVMALLESACFGNAYRQFRLRNVKDGSIIPMEAFGYAAEEPPKGSAIHSSFINKQHKMNNNNKFLISNRVKVGRI